MDFAGIARLKYVAGMRALGWILRAVLVVNFVLFISAFIPAISGIGPQPGLFDRLWGNYRLGGWRADVVWMCTSTMFIAAGGVKWIRGRGSDRATAVLCGVW